MADARHRRSGRDRRRAYGYGYGYGRNYARLIERTVVLVVIIILLGKFGIPYLYRNTAGSAYNVNTVSDIRNLAAQLKLYEEGALEGEMPVAFKRASSSRGRKFYLRGYSPTTGQYTVSDTAISTSPDVALCFTPLATTATNEVDADSAMPPYRIYGSNAWNLDVYYVYDSVSNAIVKQENPNHQPVASNDQEAMETALDPATSITFCDLKITGTTTSDGTATTDGNGVTDTGNGHNHVREDGTTLFDDMGI